MTRRSTVYKGRRALAGVSRGVRGAYTHIRGLYGGALNISGLGLISAAAWDVTRPLGLLAFGASCLIVEALLTREGRE